MRAFAVLVLNWSEQDFWDATPHALFDAIDLQSGAFKQRDFAKFKAGVEGPKPGRPGRPG